MSSNIVPESRPITSTDSGNQNRSTVTIGEYIRSNNSKLPCRDVFVAYLTDPGCVLSSEDWDEYLDGFEECGFDVYTKWETVYVDKEDPKVTESHKNRDKFYGHFKEIKDLFWTGRS
jgi:hypothetical protein